MDTSSKQGCAVAVLQRRGLDLASESVCMSPSPSKRKIQTLSAYYQGCPQDVKSQDRDETETVNLQD